MKLEHEFLKIKRLLTQTSFKDNVAIYVNCWNQSFKVHNCAVYRQKNYPLREKETRRNKIKEIQHYRKYILKQKYSPVVYLRQR